MNDGLPISNTMKSKKLFLVSAFLAAVFLQCQQPSSKGRSDVPKILDSIKKTATALPATVGDIALPEGYSRIKVVEGSFAEYLRNLPLKQHNNKVYLYNGELKPNQDVHVAVVDMEIGKTDLQQCADAVMRLRAEYLYSKALFDKISFLFVNGDSAVYSKYRQGYRLQVKGNKTWWALSARPDTSYATFRQYMDVVFMYASTYSLHKQLKPRKVSDMQPGDVFVQTGQPFGHAVIVVDMAIHEKTGEKLFLLAQSYMPAQEIHILKNFNDDFLSPWYPLQFGSQLSTPEWLFNATDLRCWP